MKSLFIIVFLLMTMLNVFIWDAMPERVAVHFGANGRPNGWASRNDNFWMLQGLYVFMFLMFYFSGAWILKIPARYVNLPNKDYWFRPENEAAARDKISRAMMEMGILQFLFFGSIGYMTMQANLHPPVRLDGSAMKTLLILFFGCILLWTVRLILAFRKPSSENPR